MTTLSKILLGIGFYGLQNCSPKLSNNTAYSGEVNFLYKDGQGTIAVKSTGYGKNLTEAVTDAHRNAFKVILFKGIPDTELNVPLIENENEVTSKNSEYFERFFNQGAYKSFIMSSTESSNLVSMKIGKKITVDVKLNYVSLRRDLEQNKITRRFGY